MRKEKEEERMDVSDAITMTWIDVGAYLFLDILSDLIVQL
jgi:hypothetical protein